MLARKTGTARNPMLVGVGAAEAAGDFARMVERQNWRGLPLEIRGVRFVSVERELGERDKEAICARMEEVGREADDSGVVVSVGDLNMVEGSEDAANCLVSELTKLLELRRGNLWVMGWSATYETYLKFLSRYPLVDKDWNLQLLPITSRRAGMAGLQPKPPSLMDSFVPFGGLFPQAYESIGTLNNPYQSLPRCQHCNEQYEKEVAAVLKRSDTSVEGQTKADFPSWLQKGDVVGIKEGFDFSKVNENKSALNANINDLQRKWNEHCQHAHRCSQILEAKACQVLPHLAIPYISDTASITKSITSPLIPQSQSNFGNALPAPVCIPKANAVSQSISVPLALRDLGPILYDKTSKSEPHFVGGFQSQQATSSNLVIQEGHTSPSSVTSVTTELALGAVNNYSFLEGKSDPEGSSRCSMPRKIDESSSSVSKVQFHASSPPFHNSLAKSSYIHPLSIPSGKTWSGISHIEQRDHNPSATHQKFDMSNCKTFYTSLVEKVGRQEEALWSISEAIIQCKTSNKRHQSPRARGAIWLSILGPDRAGKKMAAMALAELIFGRKEDLICIDLSYEGDNITDQQGLKKCGTGFWGKTMIDHIALEISKKPLSVFFLENVDKADLLAQNSLSNAIQTGKFSDSHGREFSINSSIFVTTAKNLAAKALTPEKVIIRFSEERILAVRQCQMKISIDSFSKSKACPSSKVSVIPRQESNKSDPSPSFAVFTSKRKLDFSSKLKWQDECSTSTKKLHKSTSIVLDLNLPAEELNQAEELNLSSETNSISDNSQDWLEEFFDSMDKTVSFKPFDFDALADYVVKEISRCFCNNIESNCVLEIDAKVIEQILAGTWLMRSPSDLSGWIEQVLLRSLCELRLRHKLSDCAVVRLVAKQDLLMEEGRLGMFLPSRIILE